MRGVSRRGMTNAELYHFILELRTVLNVKDLWLAFPYDNKLAFSKPRQFLYHRVNRKYRQTPLKATGSRFWHNFRRREDRYVDVIKQITMNNPSPESRENSRMDIK